MREAAGAFRDDLEIATLYADALMNVAPWDYWDAGGSKARAAVADAGALADVHVGPLNALPSADAAYDLVVIHSVSGLLSSLAVDVRGQTLAECLRVLRVGGRLLALEAGSPTGLKALFAGAHKHEGQSHTAGGAAAGLEAAGFRAVRTLGDRQGYRFVEGLKS